MELATSTLEFRSMAALLVTAGGKNPDVLGSLRQLIRCEPRRLIVLCMSQDSPLGRLASRYRFVDCASFDPPSGRDGFLATNSLLASTVLLSRAYREAFAIDEPFQYDLSLLSELERSPNSAVDRDFRFAPLWGRRTIVALHGPAVRSAAIDLESKFTEAALGNVQIADYRHFAHGRHHWLAKHPGETAVIAFVTPEDEPVASRTLDLMPPEIPVVRVDISTSGPSAVISALVHVLAFVDSAGRARNIDPGRPGVPGFGRRIYHLNAFKNRSSVSNSIMAVAIERKARVGLGMLERSGQLGFWKTAFTSFGKRLCKASFRAMVFDYDGTLCDEADRLKGCPPDIGRELLRLIKAHVVLGIATGRGKSVKHALREQIPKKYWEQVVVGYYNGGDIGLLSDDSRPDGRDAVSDSLRPVACALRSNRILNEIANFEFRLRQIKVEPNVVVSAQAVQRRVEHLVYGLGIDGIRIVHSMHSIDILAPGVTKKAVVDRVLEMLERKSEPVLCIGDRGQWPGNDCELLNQPYSLSVDDVSQDETTCWNLAPPGHRGAQAALGYLKCLRNSKTGFRFSLASGARKPV